MKQQMFIVGDGTSVLTFMKVECVTASTRTREAQGKKIVFSGWMKYGITQNIGMLCSLLAHIQ